MAKYKRQRPCFMFFNYPSYVNIIRTFFFVVHNDVFELFRLRTGVSRRSIGGVVELYNLGAVVRFLVAAKMFSSPKCPHRLWGQFFSV